MSSDHRGILLIGAPGSGKRSQAQLLSERHCLCNISISALVREALLRYNAKSSYAPHERAPQVRPPPNPDIQIPEREKYHRRIHFLNEDADMTVSNTQEALAKNIYKGEKMNDDLLVQLILDRATAPECAKGFVLHGFPRNVLQAKKVKK